MDVFLNNAVGCFKKRFRTQFGEIVAAVNLLGVRIKSVDTFKSEEYTVFDVRTSADRERLDALILYLKLEAVEFSPLGLYAATE